MRPEALSLAFARGYSAAHRGAQADDNPYHLHRMPALYREWHRGWRSYRRHAGLSR